MGHFAKPSAPAVRNLFARATLLLTIAFCLSLPLSAQSEQSTAPDSSAVQAQGTISGSVIDQTGTSVSAATVKLTRPDQSDTQQEQTNDDGLYAFTNVAPGPFQIIIVEDGFATKMISGTLKPGEALVLPKAQLALASASMEVHVSESEVEIAEVEIKEQEKQRVFGIIPNFYVTYEKDPAPMNTRQKMSLAWKSSVDPLTIAGAAFVAGIQQATDSFPGYGQGAEGYAKRFGATYADVTISTFLSGAVLPVIFKQDPRYMYKGTGSGRSRLFHAVASSFICRGDDKRLQPNYSNLIGSFATGGISNLYYPSTDRNSAMLTLETGLIRIAESAGANIFQEFIIRKLTPGLNRKAAQPVQTP
jgi:hypothetical protein